MPRLFALADLHLSTDGSKPMDVFGAPWIGHAARMAAAWDARVRAEDTVLLAGDLSWARTLEQAAGDLAWIAARPGTKLLLRGNHDGWWGSISKVRRALPEGCHALQNDAWRWEDVAVVGARGWTDPDDPVAGPGDGRIFRRELERLERSIADADARFGRAGTRVAMTHYPPRLAGRPPTDADAALRAGGVDVCVYGHLHGEDHRLAVDGAIDGLLYRFVAADAVDFAPVEILARPARGGVGS